MQRPSSFRAYMEGNRRVIFSRDMRANDSLLLRALQLDPFFHQQHSKTIQFRYWRQIIESDPDLASIGVGRVDFVIEDLFNRTSPGTRARLAAAEGQFAYALQLYAEAIAASRNPGYLYLDRANVRAIQGMHEAAIDDLTIGLTELRKQDADEDEDVVFYEAKALYEYGIGLLWTRASDVDKAREAFGRAMEEDLSFHPAHLALARLALATGDTTTALTEIALAAELAPEAPYVHFQHGELLVLVRQYAEAVAPLQKAIALEPLYADPHFALGLALAQTGDAAGARTAYEGFLARAPRRDQRRGTATDAMRALETAP
jgi:tetratricopeptide (TPR) repeat protein